MQLSQFCVGARDKVEEPITDIILWMCCTIQIAHVLPQMKIATNGLAQVCVRNGLFTSEARRCLTPNCLNDPIWLLQNFSSFVCGQNIIIRHLSFQMKYTLAIMKEMLTFNRSKVYALQQVLFGKSFSH